MLGCYIDIQYIFQVRNSCVMEEVERKRIKYNGVLIVCRKFSLKLAHRHLHRCNITFSSNVWSSECFGSF